MKRPPATAARGPSLHLRENERDLTALHLFAHLEPAEYQQLRGVSLACPQLRQMTAAARWIAARKFLAVLS